MTSIKGFIKNVKGEILLPITRAELVKDKDGNEALRSASFVAIASTNGSGGSYGLMSPEDKEKLNGTSGESLGGLYQQIQTISNNIQINGVAVNLLNKALNIKNSAEITATHTNGELTFGIAATLSNKTLANALTTANPTANLGVANKQYVDSKFSEAMNIATGALQFKGSAEKYDDISTYFNNGNYGYYFKVSKDFTTAIASTKSYDNVEFTPKKGDTLIIAKLNNSTKIVHIPSGDDVYSTIYVNDQAYTNAVNLEAVGPLTITSKGNVLTFDLPQASTTSPGYLSQADYNKFKNAAEAEVEYTSSVNSPTIQIGTLNGTAVYTHPISVYDSGIQLTSNNQIKFVGQGLSVSKDSTSTSPQLIFKTNIHTASANQLSIVDNALKLNVWSDTNDVNAGLITYGTFETAFNKLIDNFVVMSNQTTFVLTDTEKEYLK